MTAQLKCPNCGLKGHAPRDCPTKCSVCSHKGCPGNDKIKVRACVCNDKDKPPTAPIKNAAGRDMQPKFVEQLARHHARRFDIEYKKQEASAAQANETQPAESGVGALAGGTAPVSGACAAGGPPTDGGLMTYDACASEAIKDLLHIESHSITVAQKQSCEQAPSPCEELMLYGMTVDDGDATPLMRLWRCMRRTMRRSFHRCRPRARRLTPFLCRGSP